MFISSEMRASSLDNFGAVCSISSPTLLSAILSPRPASTQTMRRSRAFGNDLFRASLRRPVTIFNHRLGA